MFERTKACATEWLLVTGIIVVMLAMLMWFGIVFTAFGLCLLVLVIVNWIGSLFPNRSEATVGKGERDDVDTG